MDLVWIVLNKNNEKETRKIMKNTKKIRKKIQLKSSV